MKTEFIIDADKWRCGGQAKSPKKKLGKGSTLLLNKSGYMCCLGQCLLQEDKNLNILGVGCPSGVGVGSIKTKSNFVKKWWNDFLDNTDLSSDAISINDNPKLTISERVLELKELFKKHGLKLRFKNIKKYL